MKSEKAYLRKSHQHRSDLTGEYAFGDMGQLILLVVFLVVWIVDSFVFKYSTFLTKYVSNYKKTKLFLLCKLLFKNSLFVYRITLDYKIVQSPCS